MEENNYMYKGFDILNTRKKDKMRSEYFNPYGYNIYSSERQNTSSLYQVTKTNQDNKRK